MESPVTCSLLSSKAFPEGGIYIMRSERIYLTAVCHKIGVNGVGPHKHNDWLSFEFCVDGNPVIIDPGTYCYTGNMEMRRLFRSTAYHNTVVIDGEEQTPIHDSMFGLLNPYGEVKVIRWQSEHSHDLLEGEHTGYTRLSRPVIHRRKFLLNKEKDEVDITDSFLGQGEHVFEWYLHLNVGLDCKADDSKIAVCNNRVLCLKVAVSDFESSPQVTDGWVSRTYNKRNAAKVIYYKTESNIKNCLSFTQKFILNIEK